MVTSATKLPYHSQDRLDGNYCKKSSWPTKPNSICKIVPFHLISWNYFVCNVVRTPSYGYDYRFVRLTLDSQCECEQLLMHRANGTGAGTLIHILLYKLTEPERQTCIDVSLNSFTWSKSQPKGLLSVECGHCGAHEWTDIAQSTFTQNQWTSNKWI